MSGNLNRNIKATELLQDDELAAAIQALSKDGKQGLNTYLREEQDKLYKGVTGQKNDAITKAYGDLERASSVHNSLFYYDQRNHDLDSIQTDVYMLHKGDTDAILNDRDLAKRQYEINQWTASNGMDTLFVYQQLLIIVCTVIVLLFIWRQGILSDLMFYSLLFVLICIFVFTIVNRAQYTKYLRDPRFWNRRLFPKYKGLPSINVCGDNSFNTDAIDKTLSDTAAGLGTAATNVGEDITTTAS